MHVKELKIGMCVEYHNEVVNVIGIDVTDNRITIENPLDHHCETICCDELTDQPQLHIGCDDYY
jgi:hypothetical protein